MYFSKLYLSCHSNMLKERFNDFFFFIKINLNEFYKIDAFQAENLPIAQSSYVVLTAAHRVCSGYNYDKMTGGERREEKRSYV